MLGAQPIVFGLQLGKSAAIFGAPHRGHHVTPFIT